MFIVVGCIYKKRIVAYFELLFLFMVLQITHNICIWSSKSWSFFFQLDSLWVIIILNLIYAEWKMKDFFFRSHIWKFLFLKCMHVRDLFQILFESKKRATQREREKILGKSLNMHTNTKNMRISKQIKKNLFFDINVLIYHIFKMQNDFSLAYIHLMWLYNV